MLTLFSQPLGFSPGVLSAEPTIPEPPVVALAATTLFSHHLDTSTGVPAQQPRRRCQGQLAAESKSIPPIPRHRVRDRDTCQRGTALEGTILKLPHRVRNDHTCQQGAGTKATILNVCHRLQEAHADIPQLWSELPTCFGQTQPCCNHL